MSYFDILPSELFNIIISYINIKSDFENFLLSRDGDKYHDGIFEQMTRYNSWESMGAQLFPGKNVKTQNDFYLRNFEQELVLYRRKDGQESEIEQKLIDVNISQIKLVSISYKSYIIVTVDNELWSWGRNDYGQLGLGDFNDKNIPTKIEGHYGNIVQISRNLNTTTFINSAGEVYICGINHYYGRLGLESNQPHSPLSPTKLNLNFKVIQIAAGINIIALISDKFNVYIIGFIDGRIYRTPTLFISFLVKKISIADDSQMIIGSDGKLTFHQSDRNLSIENSSFYNIIDKSDVLDVSCSNLCNGILRKDGTIYLMGLIYRNKNYKSSFQVLNFKEAKGLSCGDIVSIIMNNNDVHILGYPKSTIVRDMIDISSSDETMILRYK